jgi:hypothetical protein
MPEEALNRAGRRKLTFWYLEFSIGNELESCK